MELFVPEYHWKAANESTKRYFLSFMHAWEDLLVHRGGMIREWNLVRSGVLGLGGVGKFKKLPCKQIIDEI